MLFAQFHPDVNPLQDTTEDAAALNEAYALLQQVGFHSLCDVLLQ